jgi:HSP20 family protein
MEEVMLKVHTREISGGRGGKTSPLLLSDLLMRWVVQGKVWRPPTDVYETEEVLVVRVEIAGMHPADFHISLEGRHLTIQGVRREGGEKRAFHQMEVHFGEFFVQIELPLPVESEGVVASYQDGFLRLVFPKVKPRRIQLTG